jgi:putative FmdB family regulatory protein
MPHYEYECKKCGHRFEIFQNMTDPKLTQCPRCGGRVERLIGPGAGLVFKGSGFYKTDYRSDTYKKAAKAETGGGESKSGGEGAAAKPEGKKAKDKPDSKAAKSESKKKPKPAE